MCHVTAIFVRFQQFCCGEDRSVLATRLHGRGFQAGSWQFQRPPVITFFFGNIQCATLPQVVEPLKCAGHASIFRVRDEPKRATIEHEQTFMFYNPILLYQLLLLNDFEVKARNVTPNPLLPRHIYP
jgi:hypothetical protein